MRRVAMTIGLLVPIVWAEVATANQGNRGAAIRRIAIQAERGQVARSAKSLVAQRALGSSGLGLRHRFGLSRAEGKVKSGALQMLKERAKAGDRAGTRDALPPLHLALPSRTTVISAQGGT